MSPTERKVLETLACHLGEGYAWPFDPIMRETGFSRRVVRRACRSLARKGLTCFAKGLWTEDGEMAGAGYAATKDGCTLVGSVGPSP